MVRQVEVCALFSGRPGADQQRIMACLQQVIAAVCPWALAYLKHLDPTQLHLESQAGPGVHAIQPFCIQSLLSKTTGAHEQHAQNTTVSFIFTQEQGLKLVATSQLQRNLASGSRKGAKAKSFQGGKQSSSKADCAEFVLPPGFCKVYEFYQAARCASWSPTTNLVMKNAL